jgi:hypothetical protein
MADYKIVNLKEVEDQLLAIGAPHTGPPSEDVELEPGWWEEPEDAS